MLYIVSTPIGNLSDITIRAIETLRSADLILAEDTRRTGVLLRHHGIESKQRPASYNERNEARRIPHVLKLLLEGQDVALVSDNGTPGISDPGYRLISEAVRAGIQVSPIPGPCAMVAGLVSSGLATDSFCFLGFVPKKPGAREEMFGKISRMDETAIVYESPHRVHKTLEQLRLVMPSKRICIAREMTKKFEEFLRGTPGEIIEKLGSRKLKGEMVFVIGKTYKNIVDKG